MRIRRKGRRSRNVSQDSALLSKTDSRPLFCDESYGKREGEREDFRCVNIEGENNNDNSLSRCSKRSKDN